jgi:tetratricopeptide (TPR) repeat protein
LFLPLYQQAIKDSVYSLLRRNKGFFNRNDTMEQENTPHQATKSLIDQLRERRFIQFTVSYLVAGWGLLQFTDWVVKRYAFAPVWVDIVMIFLIAMLPSVLLLTYNHGKPGKDQWRLVEKIMLPGNVVIAFLIIVFTFKGENLGATAERVQVTNEDGESFERLVPKNAYSKRIGLFALNGDLPKEDQWIRFGLPHLISGDLQQDNRLTALSGIFLANNYYDRYGYKETDQLPLSIQRQIAEDEYADQFFSGNIEKTENGNYKVVLNVYAKAESKPIQTIEVEHNDLQELADKISEQYQENLYLPDIQNEEFIDLPVSNLYSPNDEALEAYIEGLIETRIRNNTELAVKNYQKAVGKDPNFAEAYLELSNLLTRLNQTDAANEAMQHAMDRLAGLPEERQFIIRYFYYDHNKDMDKAIALLEMWRKLYPRSYSPYSLLMYAHFNRREVEQAKKVGLDAIKAGHTSKILLRLASYASFQGNTEEAIQYYEQFAREYPHRAMEADELGQIYIERGEFQKAKEHYEKINILKPDEYNTLSRLAQIESKMGNPDKATQLYEDAMKASKNAKDSMTVAYWQCLHYYYQGKARQSINIIEKRWELMSNVYTPYEVGREMLNFAFIQVFVHGGKEEEIKNRIQQFLSDYPDPTGVFNCSFELNYYITVEDEEGMDRIMPPCSNAIKSFAGEKAMGMIEAYHQKIKGNYKESLRLFEEYFKAIGMETKQINIVYAELYNLNKEPQKALDFLKDYVAVNPEIPNGHYQMALSYQQLGETAKAKESLNKALKAYEHADAAFLPYQQAKKLLEELG